MPNGELSRAGYAQSIAGGIADPFRAECITVGL